MSDDDTPVKWRSVFQILKSVILASSTTFLNVTQEQECMLHFHTVNDSVFFVKGVVNG